MLVRGFDKGDSNVSDSAEALDRRGDQDVVGSQSAHGGSNG